MRATRSHRHAFVTLLMLVPIASTAFGAEDPVLLSRNATYRIIGESYLYAGQHVPGTNDKAVSKHGYRPTPLVEMTDRGDALIDGDWSTHVHTAWYWRRNCKRITVELTLPGLSTIDRVHVQLPEDPELRPQNIWVDHAPPAGEWVEVDLIPTGALHALAPPTTRKAGHTFDLKGVETGRIRVMCVDQAVKTAQAGIAEIEVWGLGPTRSEQRGLVRSQPHVQSVTPAAPVRPEQSLLLTGTGKANVRLSGTPLTGGDASMLVDDDLSTFVMIENERHVKTTLVAEIDLGDRYMV